ncbi:hypothetical protein N0V82_004731 [Gnomoniopsis sp. IMI 355080]|nr:hypothetical protein N0V82_004731 [Gnomoniopsis sp. IMI 355080]
MSADFVDLLLRMEDHDIIPSWRNTKEYQEGIVRVQELRKAHFAVNGVTQKEMGIPTRVGEYNPDVDTKAYLIRFRDGRPVHGMMDTRFHEQFPSYRISVHDLIDGKEEDSPLFAPENTVNYFHFPANNMLWAERAITRYLRNKPVPSPTQANGTENLDRSNDDLIPVVISQTRSILGQKYWKSQQQSSTVTGKYLRPMCEVVSVSEGRGRFLQTMPYLHWDTARHQTKMSEAVHKETERQRKEKLQQERQLAGMRRVRHRGLQLLNAQSRQPNTAWRLENRTNTHPQIHPSTRMTPKPPKRTATGAFANIMKRHGRFGKIPQWSMFSADQSGRIIAGTEIGQVLFDAAMLYEAMNTHREKSLIQKYLHEDPPLHPRRTMEQTNEWTLSLSWHASARDQVVHRATRPKQLDFQSADPFTKEWRERIRKIPRVMMIDQLWMWILDDQTIITCFPDHGDLCDNSNLPGMHKNIRDALMKSSKGNMRTVFDIALVILSESQISRASLNGVRPQDGQVGVMQMFRQAIRDVASKHSFGAEQYWEWARIFSRLAHTDVDNGLSDLIVPFLDIGKEGELQGQIKSINRDLEIMHRITTEQKDVVEKFEKTMQHSTWRKFTPDVEPLLMEIHSNIEDIEDMRRSADDISGSVSQNLSGYILVVFSERLADNTQLDYLISLKQQQVTVVQAWQSMKQGEDNQRQNITLLVFTVVTVVFLPMSFISSVFGMNNKEIAGTSAPMTLAEQFKWMIPISFAIVAITYYTAFGSPRRMSRDLFRWFYIKAGMYRIFAPNDVTLTGLKDRFWNRNKKKEAEQEWVRRRSEQMAKDAQDRRQATRRAAIIDHASVSPDTPAITPGLNASHQGQLYDQTGMFAVYQGLNAGKGSKRTRSAGEFA